MSLAKLYFQTKVIQFTNVFMYNYNIQMLREKIKETNVPSYNKWQVSNKIPVCHILSLSACAPLWKMAHKKVNNLSTKKGFYQFQVACVLYLKLRQKVIQGED